MPSKSKKSPKSKKTKASRPKSRKKNVYHAKKEHQIFFLANGTHVKNLLQLAEVLHSLNDNHYSHHVNQERNDFSNWVRDVFQEPKLAKRIENMDKGEMQFELYRFLARKLW